MTLMVFFGCTFIAYGPSIAIFCLTIVQRPLRIIIVVFGAFAWLVSLLVSALLWLAVVPLRKDLAFSLFFSVVFQELSRFGLIRLLHKSRSGLDEALNDQDKAAIAGFRLPYATGFGFGFMAGTFSIINVLSNSIGPGNVGIHGTYNNFVLVSSILTSMIILLHIFWHVILTKAYKNKNWFAVALVVTMHLLVSMITLLNVTPNLFYVSVGVFSVILLISGGWAFSSNGGSFTSLKSAFSSLSCNY